MEMAFHSSAEANGCMEPSALFIALFLRDPHHSSPVDILGFFTAGRSVLQTPFEVEAISQSSAGLGGGLASGVETRG